MSPYSLIFVSNTGTKTLAYSGATSIGSFSGREVTKAPIDEEAE
jgi:hypothetical protein